MIKHFSQVRIEVSDEQKGNKMKIIQQKEFFSYQTKIMKKKRENHLFFSFFFSWNKMTRKKCGNRIRIFAVVIRQRCVLWSLLKRKFYIVHIRINRIYDEQLKKVAGKGKNKIKNVYLYVSIRILLLLLLLLWKEQRTTNE